MCKFYQEGRCKRGEDCRFAHDGLELHQVGDRLVGNEKRLYEQGRRAPTSKPMFEELGEFEELEEGEECEGGEAVEEVSAAGDETLSAHNEAASVSVSSTAADEPAIPSPREAAIGETDGTAVCTGKWTFCGRSLWIGTQEDAQRSSFLNRRKISAVVRCKRNYHQADIQRTHHVTWINGSCWDSSPGEFPFNTRSGVGASEFFNGALVNMCQQIDHSARDGDVLFYCKAGKNRSFAAAIAYIMWSARQAPFQMVRARMMQMHSRFRVSEYTQTIHGRERRGLAQDLRNWEEFLLRYTPPSSMLATPVLVTPPSGM